MTLTEARPLIGMGMLLLGITVMFFMSDYKHFFDADVDESPAKRRPHKKHNKKRYSRHT